MTRASQRTAASQGNQRLALWSVVLGMVLVVFAAGCGRKSARDGDAISPFCLKPIPVAFARETAHDRYRAIMYRRVCDADVIGFKDDCDAFWLQEHPTHLTPWYNR